MLIVSEFFWAHKIIFASDTVWKIKRIINHYSVSCFNEQQQQYLLVIWYDNEVDTYARAQRYTLRVEVITPLRLYEGKFQQHLYSTHGKIKYGIIVILQANKTKQLWCLKIRVIYLLNWPTKTVGYMVLKYWISIHFANKENRFQSRERYASVSLSNVVACRRGK